MIGVSYSAHAADLNLVPTKRNRTEGAAIWTEDNFCKWLLADWGLDRKRFIVEREKGITGDLKSLEYLAGGSVSVNRT